MTDLEIIYDTFLSKISDYSFLTIEQEDMKYILKGYYKSAKAKFYKCKKDLSLDETGNLINDDIDDFEIEIIVTLMLVEYLKPILLSTEVTKQSLSDKDFKIYSQANQLRELNLLYRLFQKESRKLMTEYSYIGMTEKVHNDK